MRSGTANALPDDYLERVYAGVLGKLIGVYLGRPIEQWTHQAIMERFGHIRYYLTGETPQNLVDADDDVSGTFAFIRALEEHGLSADIGAAAIGKTWLNNAVEDKCPFWWGGNGFSTEHTAYLNLAKGIEAPRSGSIETNGKTIAEQIGGQIFVDGWALVAPGQPELAARLADAAASVSHDGEARYAARSWAAMEAEAFVSKDVDHLLEVGCRFIPEDSLLTKVIADVRRWVKLDNDWLKVRQRIEDVYGYDKFGGSCHVMPNHAIMILGLICGGHSFHEAMHIINTCGWDTDCNSGNLGCLVAIMHGLPGIDNGGPDWRGPLADRAIVSSADGGYTVNNAARIAYDIANSGMTIAGRSPLKQPKDAQFHFSLPGCVQGFQVFGGGSPNNSGIRVEQSQDPQHGSELSIHWRRTNSDPVTAEISTPTFVQPETRKGIEGYAFVGTPLIYPGQRVGAFVRADESNTADIQVQLRLQYYTTNPDPAEVPMYRANPDLDMLVPLNSPPITLSPGSSEELAWTIPDSLDGQPIARIGIAVSSPLETSPFEGKIYLRYLRWRGSPDMKIKKPANASINPSQAWREAWVDASSTFNWYMPKTFGISKARGEGKIIYGTRDWDDYKIKVSGFAVLSGSAAGIMVRNRGVNRYYALIFTHGGEKVGFVKALDEKRLELASERFRWELDRAYEVEIVIEGNEMVGVIDGREVLRARDDQFVSGGIGLVVVDGATAADEFTITPVE